jgi:hypothetical protein
MVFLFGFGVIAASVGKNFVMEGRLLHPTDLGFHAIFAAALLAGALTKNELYHKTLVLFISALFIVYIVVLYARIA